MERPAGESSYTPIANIARDGFFRQWFDEKLALDKRRAEEGISSYAAHRDRLGPPTESFLSHNARFYIWRSKKAGWQVNVPSARLEEEGTQFCVDSNFTPTGAIRAWKDYHRRMGGAPGARGEKGRRKRDGDPA